MIFDGTINVPTIVTVFLAALGAVIWLVRMESRVNSNSKAHADLRQTVDLQHGQINLIHNQLHEHKTHVAEHYVTKQGMSEQTDRIMKSIADVGTRIDGIGARLDRFYENPPVRSRRSSGQ